MVLRFLVPGFFSLWLILGHNPLIRSTCLPGPTGGHGSFKIRLCHPKRPVPKPHIPTELLGPRLTSFVRRAPGKGEMGEESCWVG
jgi:hypothetical protein